MIVELGSPENPFAQDYNVLHNLTTNTWIKMAWQFQHKHNIQIKTDLPHLKESRINDQFLVQSFVESRIIGAELSRINRCRIYLQVTTLADICDGMGAYILPDMWAR